MRTTVSDARELALGQPGKKAGP